jgi:LPXTG-site transpeptidase (sortase) family protein
MKKVIAAIFAGALFFVCFVSDASAADYTFPAKNKDDYYRSTLYEDVYGSEYNYGGPNVTDFADTTALLPGILSNVQASGSSYRTGAADTAYYAPETYPFAVAGGVTVKPYTSASELTRSDGSIGTLEIPSLSITVKVYEGTGPESLGKGAGHFPDTSAWFGNVGIAGHNRGSKYNIGSIKNLQVGDVIIYSTDLGTRRYAVTFTDTISETDMSYLSATRDNRITFVTCLADRPSLRVCVQATEI